jgi:hypothetical protein|tara:strand:+ start:1477 stop:1623 length:147 start_codon:yes stop_codon:yes gene_type:complete
MSDADPIQHYVQIIGPYSRSGPGKTGESDRQRRHALDTALRSTAVSFG